MCTSARAGVVSPCIHETECGLECQRLQLGAVQTSAAWSANGTNKCGLECHNWVQYKPSASNGAARVRPGVPTATNRVQCNKCGLECQRSHCQPWLKGKVTLVRPT
jgi:hypothetical protein